MMHVFFQRYLGFNAAELEGASAFFIATALVALAVLLLVSPYGGTKVRVGCRYVIGYWAVMTGIAAIFATLAVVVGDCERPDPETDGTTAVDPRVTCSGPGGRTTGGHIRHFVQLGGYTVALVPFFIYYSYRAVSYASVRRLS